VRVSAGSLTVLLVDGREISVRIDEFPRLARGTAAQLAHWEFIGDGVGIHWPDLDEDISVEGLLHPDRTLKARFPVGPGNDERFDR
jgi:hypothetical protein